MRAERSGPPRDGAGGVNGRAIAFLALAALGFACLLAGQWDWAAVLAGRRAQVALQSAEALKPGLDREIWLTAAQTQWEARLARRPEDSAAWAGLAEVLLLEATNEGVRPLSTALLQASLQAQAEASLRGRVDAADSTRRSLAASLLPNEGLAAQHLQTSYQLQPMAAELSPRRVQVAQRVWSRLDGRTRSLAAAEACALLNDASGTDAQGFSTSTLGAQAEFLCARRER